MTADELINARCVYKAMQDVYVHTIKDKYSGPNLDGPG